MAFGNSLPRYSRQRQQ